MVLKLNRIYRKERILRFLLLFFFEINNSILEGEKKVRKSLKKKLKKFVNEITQRVRSRNIRNGCEFISLFL